MRYNIKILLTVCILCFCCKKEEVPAFFDGEDVVYFGYTFILDYKDSLGINFYDIPENKLDTIIKFSVFAQGRMSDKNREIKLSTAGSTAKQGEDFIIPEKIEIPANKIKVDIPIRIIRTSKLRKKALLIHFKLEPNEYFNTNLKGKDITQRYDEFKFAFTDFIEEPDYWKEERYKKILGPFSVKKLQLLAKITQSSNDKKPFEKSVKNWLNRKVSDLNLADKLLKEIKPIKAYLKEQKDAGTPVLEDDGKPMVLGPDA